MSGIFTMFRSLLCFSLVAVVHSSIGPVADMHVVNQVISPDGFHRSAVLASSSGAANSATFPGPVVTATKGDRIRINVINSLKDTTMLRGTSIHWHGIYQKNSSWEDGAAGINQCPIASGDSFLYDFSVANQAGTFWYHSHYSAQYCDGLRGPLVIYDPHDPHKKLYDVDDGAFHFTADNTHSKEQRTTESTIITLADWYHDPTPELLKRTSPFNASSILINGKGRYPGGQTSPLSVITVKQNTRYRFRLISLSCDPSFTFSIDNHIMSIIEVDGVNVEPLDVDSIQIFTGQRYSFILKANKPGHPQNFWIRAIPSYENSAMFDGGIYAAILRYSGAPNVESRTTSAPASNFPMLETNLHPLENHGAPGGNSPADLSLNLAIDFDFDKFYFTINGETFTPPTVPVLLQILSGARDAKDLLPAEDVYILKPNQVVEITIPGGSRTGLGFPHPFHLHGHNFAVVRSAGSETYNYVNPVVRDVVSTGTEVDNVTIRFTTDNAGPWFMHCHIEWHLELGLAIVFAEDVPTLASQRPPEAWDRLCPRFDAQEPE